MGGMENGAGAPVIRLATLSDAEAIAATYKELHEHEKLHGSHTNWPAGVYPTLAGARARIAACSMYALEQDGSIRASMALDSCLAPEYAGISWRHQADSGKALTIHGLCVAPSAAGRGHGRRMLDFAKQFGRANGFSVIRIDTWIHNEPARALYMRNGFEIAGFSPMDFPGWSMDEVLLELKL